jgi:hypothetical protein
VNVQHRESVGCAENISKREVYTYYYLQCKRELSNNLMIHLDTLENKNKTTSKLVEKKK